MGVIDRFLNAMKMNDDDVTEGDYLDDEYDEDEFDDLDLDEEHPKRHFLTHSDREEESLPDTKETGSVSSANGPSSSSSSKPVRTRQSQSSSKVSPMRSNRRPGMEVCVIRPRSMEDAREVTETLLDECTVILNMEGIDFELAQRIIDFACGSCYAIQGKLQKISNYIFIITPSTVDISGDFQDMVSGTYDVPSFGTDF